MKLLKRIYHWLLRIKYWLKSNYHMIRDRISTTRHFGKENAKYKMEYLKWTNKCQFQLDDETGRERRRYQKTLDLQERLLREYEMILDAEAELTEYALGTIALCTYDRTQAGMPTIIYTDECCANGEYNFKPDYAPETLEEQNYIGKNFLVRKEWYEAHKIGEAYELLKHASEEGTSFLHIAQPLITNTEAFAKVNSTPKMLDKNNHPSVSILIPSKDHMDILKRCIDSIQEKSTYDNYEIVVVENNSTEEATFAYYKEIEKNDKVRIQAIETDWNYSYINNQGRNFCKGEYLLLLNNDVEVISPDFLEQMLYYATRDEIGAVGAKLLFPDDTIQHAGVTLGIRGVAGHAFRLHHKDEYGYMSRIQTVQNLGAVTAACLMIRTSIFDEIGGFDEEFKVAFNDVDLCMRIRKAGYRIVYTPHACLYHYESKSRGTDEQSPEKLARFNQESMRFQRRWFKEILQGDPYYNKNLSPESDEFEYIDKYRSKH